MRQKTILLGLTFLGTILLLMSGRPSPTEADTGLNPGEKLPSIMVDGKDLTAEFSGKSEAILVVWSVDDATSRVVNSWLSNNQNRDAVIPVYSICLDAEQQDAEYYAQLDNMDTKHTKLWGAYSGKGRVRNDVRKLASNGSAKVFYTTNGMIQKVESTSTLWEKIQKEMAI